MATFVILLNEPEKWFRKVSGVYNRLKAVWRNACKYLGWQP